MTTDTPQAVSIPPYVIRLERELASKTAELAEARLERDEAIEANHSVAVCAEHTAEITVGECVVCRAESAEAKLAEAQAVLQNPDMWMRWCDNKVLERCESAEARLHDVEQQYTAACLKLMDADLKLAESAREYERQNSKLREAELDAARYRWLRDNKNAYPLFFIAQRDPSGIVVQFKGDLADMNIDATIDAQGKP